MQSTAWKLILTSDLHRAMFISVGIMIIWKLILCCLGTFSRIASHRFSNFFIYIISIFSHMCMSSSYSKDLRKLITFCISDIHFSFCAPLLHFWTYQCFFLLLWFLFLKHKLYSFLLKEEEKFHLLVKI